MIDSHAHVNDEILIEKAQQINDQCLKNNVSKIINVGYDLTSSNNAVALSKKFNNMFAVIGVHPENANTYSEQTENALTQLAKNKKVVAIGEIGLDYHFLPFDKDLQKEVFEKQIKLANKLNLPIVVHTRDATQDTLNILKSNEKFLKNGVLIHCFNGSLETLNEVIKRGYYVSFGGTTTFKNAKGLLNIVKNCPIENILLETDCPYLSPEPFRGQTNTPANIPIIANKIAELKEMTVEKVEEITDENSIKFFNLKN